MVGKYSSMYENLTGGAWLGQHSKIYIEDTVSIRTYQSNAIC